MNYNECVEVIETYIVNKEGQIVMEEVTMESLFNQFADASAVEEANRYRVVPKGPYHIQITKAEPRLTKQDENDPAKPRRPYARFTASVLSPDGKKQASVFFNGSWQVGRRADGKLDGMTKLWGNIEKAINAVGKSVGEVLGETTKYPVQAFIDVVYEDQGGQRYYIRANDGVSAEDQEKQYRELGYIPSNSVVNISAIRG